MLIPENDFERRIVSTCIEVSQLLLFKNRGYTGSYRNTRQRYKDLFNNPRLVFDMHLTEKRDRYLGSRITRDETGKDTGEDSALDVAGLAILEVICRRLDD